MIDYKNILETEPYALKKEYKRNFLNETLNELTKEHYHNCEEYKKIIDSFNYDVNVNHEYTDIPFLPVRLFKMYDLLSVEKTQVVKTMTSSGTSGQNVSKIFLDKETSSTQTKILSKIVSSYIGKKRLPMIILDTSAIVKDRKMFSARGAGILGFSIFGKDKIYALDDEMNLKIDELKAFLEKHSGEKILLFGFTFMIWKHFYQKIKNEDVKIDLSNAVLIHGGGWKKLISESVSKDEFKHSLNRVLNIDENNIHDYYGMVEQTGTIYVECEYGHLHTSVYSDVIIRNPKDFSIAKIGEIGLIEVVSMLAKSYPGHVLLTEDIGMILGEDDCPCGRKGKYFEIHGRIKNAELRGCSDTYARKFE